jgi:hypothetical protein
MTTDVSLGRKILRAIADKTYAKMPRTTQVRRELELLVKAGFIIMPATFWVRLTMAGTDFVTLSGSELRWSTARLLLEQRHQRAEYLTMLGALQELRERELKEAKVG